MDSRMSGGALFTDFYELTMAQVYFRAGLHSRNVQFDYFFRSYPDYGAHRAGYCINAGLQWLAEWMHGVRFDRAVCERLRGHRGSSGEPLFKEDFLDWLLRNGCFGSLSVEAIAEGRVVHPQVPVVSVRGPLAMAQILESSLLNHLNYQTLVATKAARMKEAGRGRPVIEFGLRRAQHTAANAGTRAALIGGADFSSNTGISYALGLPPKGTHAHSMVQTFMSTGAGELDAFRMYAEVYPDDCLLLVDTIDTLGSGLPNAIKVFEDLRARGHRPLGIRLDSGDLAYLCIQAAALLDKSGFPDAAIVLSGQLDELVLWQILTQIDHESGRYGVESSRLIDRLVFGIGTRLITSEGHPALDGVYKLVAVEQGGIWQPAFKISESAEKVSNPGRKKAARLYDTAGMAIADLLSTADEDIGAMERIVLHHPVDPVLSRELTSSQLSAIEPLTVEIIREGRAVYEWPELGRIRAVRDADLGRLYPGVKQLVSPHDYHVSLTDNLWNLKQRLVGSARSRLAGAARENPHAGIAGC